MFSLFVLMGNWNSIEICAIKYWSHFLLPNYIITFLWFLVLVILTLSSWNLNENFLYWCKIGTNQSLLTSSKILFDLNWLRMGQCVLLISKGYMILWTVSKLQEIIRKNLINNNYYSLFQLLLQRASLQAKGRYRDHTRNEVESEKECKSSTMSTLASPA